MGRSRPFNLHDWKTRWVANAAELDGLDLAAAEAGQWPAALHGRLCLLAELADALASVPMLDADYLLRPLLWACQDAARFIAFLDSEKTGSLNTH